MAAPATLHRKNAARRGALDTAPTLSSAGRRRPRARQSRIIVHRFGFSSLSSTLPDSGKWPTLAPPRGTHPVNDQAALDAQRHNLISLRRSWGRPVKRTSSGGNPFLYHKDLTRSPRSSLWMATSVSLSVSSTPSALSFLLHGPGRVLPCPSFLWYWDPSCLDLWSAGAFVCCGVAGIVRPWWTAASPPLASPGTVGFAAALAAAAAAADA